MQQHQQGQGCAVQSAWRPSLALHQSSARRLTDLRLFPALQDIYHILHDDAAWQCLDRATCAFPKSSVFVYRCFSHFPSKAHAEGVSVVSTRLFTILVDVALLHTPAPLCVCVCMSFLRHTIAYCCIAALNCGPHSLLRAYPPPHFSMTGL